MTTRPLRDSAVRWGWGRSCTAGAEAARPPPLDDQGYGPEGLKEFEPMFELEHRQAASQLTPRATAVYFRLGSRLAARRRRVRRAGTGSRRDDQRRLAADRRRLHVRRRLSVLLRVSRQESLWLRSPPRHTRRAIQQRPRFRADEPLGAVWPPLRRHRGRRAAGGSGARRAVRLPPGDA